MKSEKTDVKSDHCIEEPVELDFMVKIEVKTERYNEILYADENQSLKVENQGYDTSQLYYNLLDYKTDEERCQDGSFRSLQEFCLDECMICHKVFIDRYNLIKHNSTHLRILVDFPKTYQCDYCSIYFIEKSKLVNHIYCMHCKNNNDPKSNKLHFCLICKKQYKYKNWHEHVTSVHGNEKFECTMCNVSFKCLRYLKTHNRCRHGSGYKPGAFECNYCPKTFHINDCLNKHIKNCHGSPAQCEICKSKLKSVVYLKTHMRRVHYNDGKVHKCNICFKKFKSPRYVRIHIKNTHANLNRDTKVYVSCECGETYASVRKLESHLKVCAVSLKL